MARRRREWFPKGRRGDRYPTEWKRPLDKLSEHSVVNDRWDAEDLSKVRNSVKPFEGARDKLGEFAKTGDKAMDDMFFSLLQVDPTLEDPNKMRPTIRVNRMIMEQAWDLDEMDRLRRYTIGDDVQAAMSAVTMEPDLETLFDKTEQQRKAAQELEDQIRAAQQAQQEKFDLDQLVRDWLDDQGMEQEECPTCEGTGVVPDDDPDDGDGDGEGEGEGEGQGEGQGEPGGQGQGQPGDGDGDGDGEGQPGGSGTKECPTCHGDGHGAPTPKPGKGGGKGKSKGAPRGELTPEQQAQLDEFARQQRELADKVREANERAEAAAKEFDDSMGTNRATIRETLSAAMNKATNEASALNETASAWGLEPGQLQRMNAEERMELARRLDNDRFRRVADLFGPMKNMMLTEQRRKTINTREEIVDVEMGDDLSRILPSEMLLLADEDSEWLFLKKYTERALVQYMMEGQEKLARGGIIICEDGSGSMHGEREMWAKAVMLCLLHLSRIQKRSFRLIHFGSPGQFKVIEFTKPEDYTIDRILDAAELFFGGGTDFYTPMNRALEFLQEDHEKTGETRADIVFVTDDECHVDPEFMEHFLEESTRMDFTTWGISVTGGERRPGALDTMSRGKVAKIKDFGSGDDIRSIFRGAS